MPRTHDGQEYLSGPEARKMLGAKIGVDDISQVVFLQLVRQNSIQSYTFPGAGMVKFYLKSDLDTIELGPNKA